MTDSGSQSRDRLFRRKANPSRRAKIEEHSHQWVFFYFAIFLKGIRTPRGHTPYNKSCRWQVLQADGAKSGTVSESSRSTSRDDLHSKASSLKEQKKRALRTLFTPHSSCYATHLPLKGKTFYPSTFSPFSSVGSSSLSLCLNLSIIYTQNTITTIAPKPPTINSNAFCDSSSTDA